MLTEEELDRQRKTVFRTAPLISIPVPLYNTPLPYLKEMIDSVLDQSYENWELCLADGSSENGPEQFVRDQYGKETRIKYRRLDRNTGIAGNTNAAVAMAEGAYIGLLDHDDLLAPDALFEVVQVINRHPDADAVYTDEDKVRDNLAKHFEPAFKPDFNLDLLRSCNYICHFFVAKKCIVDGIGGFRSDFDGSQDYDFILRCVEKARAVYHIPKVLYHWRCHPDSVAGNPESKLYAYEAGRRAVEEHLRRVGEPDAQVERLPFWGHYRVNYPVKSRDRIDILISDRGSVRDLRRCVDSVLKKSTYDHYHIFIVGSADTEQQDPAYQRELLNTNRVTFLRSGREKNESAVYNDTVRQCDGQYLVFLHCDTEVIAPDWLERMLANCQREEVGIVGAKLYFPNGSISHAGVVVGMNETAGSVMVGDSRRSPGYLNRLQIQLNYSAVTGDCMMISRQLFEEMGGFDENLNTEFYDTDLCLRAGERDKRIVFDPKIEMYSYKPRKKGRRSDGAETVRMQCDRQYFRDRWKGILEKGDPCYNVNWTLERGDFSIRRGNEDN